MPLGLQRLNERTQRPNAHINFIKPLASSSTQDQNIARDFLERIAAQCYPVMKRDYISVMSLEEYPPNPEFLGRNFNAGEVIQLVLKDKAGRWLSFTFVQMVMMHELAHCKQMNHSRYFWKVRNQYADHMKELWSKKYEGEGLWGRGQAVTTGEFVHDRMPNNVDIPEHLCGGTYRRARGKKRKRGQDGSDHSKLSYAERQQKRIAKKFGVHGDGKGLGEDELVRGALEHGKRHYGKPRVANSKRGRELRANAALARFDAVKQQPEMPDLTDDAGSETESDSEFSDDEFGDRIAILETLGKIEDGSGHDLYRVCGDEEGEEDGGKNEMDDIKAVTASERNRSNGASTFYGADKNTKPVEPPHEDSETESEAEIDTPGQPPQADPGINESSESPANRERVDNVPYIGEESANRQSGSGIEAGPRDTDSTITLPVDDTLTCSICSLENEVDSPTCIACSHVLKTSLMPNHWRCKSDQCRNSKYVNAGDVGRCGLCGALQPAVKSKPMSVTSSDVLRWD